MKKKKASSFEDVVRFDAADERWRDMKRLNFRLKYLFCKTLTAVSISCVEVSLARVTKAERERRFVVLKSEEEIILMFSTIIFVGKIVLIAAENISGDRHNSRNVDFDIVLSWEIFRSWLFSSSKCCNAVLKSAESELASSYVNNFSHCKVWNSSWSHFRERAEGIESKLSGSLLSLSFLSIESSKVSKKCLFEKSSTVNVASLKFASLVNESFDELLLRSSSSKDLTKSS